MTVSSPSDFEKALEWRARMDDGLDQTERLDFEDWMAKDRAHKAAFVHADLAWESMGLLRPDAEFDALKNIALDAPDLTVSNDNIGFRAGGRWKAKAIGGVLTALAASLILFYMIGSERLFTQHHENQWTQYSTPPSVQKVVNLPDGSRITLGAGSQIELNLSENARNVRLSRGAAFFDVRSNPDRPFMVLSAQASIKVVGTRFDTQVFENSMAIGVIEGEVQVGSAAAPSGYSQPLTAGQFLMIEDGVAGSVEKRSLQEIGAWRAGKLVYREAPLSRIIAEANRYTKDELTLDPAIADLQLTGVFRTDDIDGLIAIIGDTLPVRVEAQKNGRRISAR